MTRKLAMIASAIALAVGLSACGGGGGEGPGFIPAPPTPSSPPTTPPPPTSQAAVTIFPDPTPQEFATVGVSTEDSLVESDDRLTSVSTAAADRPRIRYNSGGFYEVMLPGRDWDRLVHYEGLVNPTSDNNYFQPSSAAQNEGYVVISNSRNAGYVYSELASWGNLNLSAEGGFGFFAFGTPTPAGSVPATGTATYAGTVAGTTDVMQPDFLFGQHFPTFVDGTVTLAFDFCAGSLSGEMSLLLGGATDLGTFAFTQTVFSPGSTTYSGRFDTDLPGFNFFNGLFTGPNAEETIGSWAVPFTFEGENHQAMGAWIARQGS